MYTFKKETDLKAYDDFIETNGGQYIQCSRWEKVKTTWKCTYYSGFENEKRVLAVLVMERDLPAAGKKNPGDAKPKPSAVRGKEEKPISKKSQYQYTTPPRAIVCHPGGLMGHISEKPEA